MFKYLLFTFSVCLLFACTPEDPYYNITGVVENFNDGDQVILQIFDPVTQIRIPVDTADIQEGGNYTIQFHLIEPDLFRLDLPGRQNTMLVIDNGQKNIVVNAEGKRGGELTISGSPDSEKLLQYDVVRAESNERLIKPAYAAMREAKDAGNVQEEVDAVDVYVKKSKTHRQELLDFTEQNIGTSIALYGTMLRWTGDSEVDRLERLVNAFAEKHPNLNMTQKMLGKVERYKKVAIGVKAPALKAKTPQGELLELENILGKYTLIDFWASWCGPCISQFPDLQEAYSRFHENGFEILSVSVDRKEEKWLDAVEKYEMPWLHMSDAKGWESPLASEYNVTFIPFNLLLDSEGVIIAKNLHSKSLQKTLEDLFAES